jgi:hypothetical protein
MASFALGRASLPTAIPRSSFAHLALPGEIPGFAFGPPSLILRLESDVTAGPSLVTTPAMLVSWMRSAVTARAAFVP